MMMVQEWLGAHGLTADQADGLPPGPSQPAPAPGPSPDTAAHRAAESEQEVRPACVHQATNATTAPACKTRHESSLANNLKQALAVHSLALLCPRVTFLLLHSSDPCDSACNENQRG